MNKDENVLLKSISVDLNEDENFEELVRELKLLKNQGFVKTDVLIYKNVVEEVKLKGIDLTIFNNIKKKQDLPDYVVLEFIESEGVIEERNYMERVKDAAGIS